MQIIPLIAVPSQTLQVQLGGQTAQINVYALNTPGDILVGVAPVTADSTLVTADDTLITADEDGGTDGDTTTLELASSPAIYFDLLQDGVPIVSGRLARNLMPLLLGAAYQGFAGDFAFIDTQGSGLDGTDPQYTGLGSQYQLVYLEPPDLG